MKYCAMYNIRLKSQVESRKRDAWRFPVVQNKKQENIFSKTGEKFGSLTHSLFLFKLNFTPSFFSLFSFPLSKVKLTWSEKEVESFLYNHHDHDYDYEEDSNANPCFYPMCVCMWLTNSYNFPYPCFLFLFLILLIFLPWKTQDSR